jgi:hypothetical protein
MIVPDVFPSAGVTALCIDRMWPGHTQMFRGRGHSVPLGFEVNVYPLAHDLWISVLAYEGVESEALAYVLGLLRGDVIAAAEAPYDNRSPERFSKPVPADMAAWLTDGAVEERRWSKDRCRAQLRRSDVGRMSLSVSSGDAGALARVSPALSTLSRERSNPAAVAGDTPVGRSAAAPRPPVLIAVWPEGDVSGVLVVEGARGEEASPVWSTLAIGRLIYPGWPVYRRLRDELNLTYTPLFRMVDGSAAVFAEVGGERLREAADALVTLLGSAAELRARLPDAAGGSTSLRELLERRWRESDGLRLDRAQRLEASLAAVADGVGDELPGAIAERFANATVTLLVPALTPDVTQAGCELAARGGGDRVVVRTWGRAAERVIRCRVQP